MRDSTAQLLSLARGGDRTAREHLFARYSVILRRLAHGRIPPGARDLADTDDLVQDTLLRAFKQLDVFEPRREGAFLAYLRQILLNRIRDVLRNSRRRPGLEPLGEDLPHPGLSPLESAIGSELIAAYEAALASLTPEQREGIVLRLEMGFTYPEIAEALGSPSANAARMMVSRALLALAEMLNAQA